MKTSSLIINVDSSRVPGRYILPGSSKNAVNIRLTEHGRIHKIFYVTDIEKLLEIDDLEEYINNASF